eukprot:7690278-Ditylum_brightwellii.AAC.1
MDAMKEAVDDMKLMQNDKHTKYEEDKKTLEEEILALKTKLDLVEASLQEKEREIVELKAALENEKRSRTSD